MDSYLRSVTEGNHLLRTFDAVLGATAIALASSASDRAAIRAAIDVVLRTRAARETDANAEVVLRSYARSVSVAVDDPRRAEVLTLKRGRRLASARGAREEADDWRLAVFLALDDDIDGAEIDEDGLLPSVLLLPQVTSASPAVFFATSETERHLWRDWTITGAVQLLKRSGPLRSCSCGSGRPAHECCSN